MIARIVGDDIEGGTSKLPGTGLLEVPPAMI